VARRKSIGRFRISTDVQGATEVLDTETPQVVIEDGEAKDGPPLVVERFVGDGRDVVKAAQARVDELNGTEPAPEAPAAGSVPPAGESPAQ
jgi:hypothetical protein